MVFGEQIQLNLNNWTSIATATTAKTATTATTKNIKSKSTDLVSVVKTFENYAVAGGRA